MEINPYQSPRPGEPVNEPKLDDTASIRQLLVEIRDAQRETADLLRQAQAQSKTVMRSLAPMRIIGIVLPLLFLAYFLYQISKTRAFPILPPKAPIRAPR
jgi:hypothetical protein